MNQDKIKYIISPNIPKETAEKAYDEAIWEKLRKENLKYLIIAGVAYILSTRILYDTDSQKRKVFLESEMIQETQRREEMLPTIEQCILKILSDSGIPASVVYISVFGSVEAGTATKDSDIDISIRFDYPKLAQITNYGDDYLRIVNNYQSALVDIQKSLKSIKDTNGHELDYEINIMHN